MHLLCVPRVKCDVLISINSLVEGGVSAHVRGNCRKLFEVPTIEGGWGVGGGVVN